MSPPISSLQNQPLSSSRCRNIYAAPVLIILRSGNQALLFERVDNARHRWRANLFSRGEIAVCNGAIEDDNRKRGQAGCIESSSRIFLAEDAEQVDGGGVQLPGRLERRRGYFC